MTTSSDTEERFSKWLRELEDVDNDVGMLEQFSGCLAKLNELLGPPHSYYVRSWATRSCGQAIVIGLRRHLVMPDKEHDVTLLGTLTRMVDGGTCDALVSVLGAATIAQRLGCAEAEVVERLRERINADRKRIKKAGDSVKILADRIAHLRLGDKDAPARTIRARHANLVTVLLRRATNDYIGLLTGVAHRPNPRVIGYVQRFETEVAELLAGKDVAHLP